jgi:hypothetical protein
MMKALVVAFALVIPSAASAQVWSCTVNGIACQPGTTGCQCAEVQQTPQVVTPPVYVPQYVPQYIPQYVPQPYYVHPYVNPYGNVPFNQQPGWPHR